MAEERAADVTHYYPVFLDLRERHCVVAGGGPLAAAKATELLAAGARVTVFSRHPGAAIATLARDGRLRLRRREYRDGDLAGAFLAVAALEATPAAASAPVAAGSPAAGSAAGTVSAEPAGHAAVAAIALRDAIWREAERRGVLLNSVDDAWRSSFIAGSVVRRGALTVAISTSGKAPALAVRLRQWLEGVFGSHHARFLELAGSVRAALAARRPAFGERRELWYQLVDSDALDLLQRGDEPAARRRFAEILGVEVQG